MVSAHRTGGGGCQRGLARCTSGSPRPHFLQRAGEAGERHGVQLSRGQPAASLTPTGQRPRVRIAEPVLGSAPAGNTPWLGPGQDLGWAHSEVKRSDGPAQKAPRARRGRGQSGARAGLRLGAGSIRGRVCRKLECPPWPCAPPPALACGARLRFPSFPRLAGGPRRLQAADGRTGGLLHRAPSLTAGFLLSFWAAMSTRPARRLRAHGGPSS